MSNFTAVLDANVLHAYPLASVLLELAEARMYRACWSAEIHAEWMRSVQRARPEIPPSKLERRRDAMDIALPDACISGHPKFRSSFLRNSARLKPERAQVCGFPWRRHGISVHSCSHTFML